MFRDPHEHNERTARVAKVASDEKFLETLNDVLAKAPALAPAASEQAASLPILYVVGLPRSGTTLLCQLMARYLKIGYIDNIVARFWRRPSAGIRLSRILLGENARESITFDSHHGNTPEPAGPHEFGYYWRSWFDVDSSRTHHLTAAELAKVDAEGLKASLENEFLATFNLPVVFKGVLCGFHAKFLADLHPNSLFVHIKRDRVANGSSILQARKSRYGNYEAWWSLKPSTYPFTPKPADPVEEVVRQMNDVDSEIAAELARPGVHSVEVNYERFCADPGTMLDQLVAAVARMGGNLERAPGELPALKGAGPKLPEEMLARLRTLVG